MITLENALESAHRCLLMEQPQKAEQITQLVLSIAPHDPAPKYLLGRALYAQGKIDQAVALFAGMLWHGPVVRWYVIQTAIAHLNAKTYLEIGVAEGYNFSQIEASLRIGVDPIRPAPLVQSALQKNATIQYFQTTSDDFFQAIPECIVSSGIDVAFIDGLHTYAQSLADVENCLKHLNPGGVIFLHDCNPQAEEVAMATSSLEDVRRRGWDGPWTGDVWKTILHLRSLRSDLAVCVLDCDFGIGMVFRGRTDPLLPYSPERIRQLTYQDLAANRKNLLGLVQPQELLTRLRSRADQRRSR